MTAAASAATAGEPPAKRARTAGPWEQLESVAIRDYGAPSVSSVAAFDMDSTLILTKSGKTFPTSKDSDGPMPSASAASALVERTQQLPLESPACVATKCPTITLSSSPLHYRFDSAPEVLEHASPKLFRGEFRTSIGHIRFNLANCGLQNLVTSVNLGLNSGKVGGSWPTCQKSAGTFRGLRRRRSCPYQLRTLQAISVRRPIGFGRSWAMLGPMFAMFATLGRIRDRLGSALPQICQNLDHARPYLAQARPQPPPFGQIRPGFDRNWAALDQMLPVSSQM